MFSRYLSHCRLLSHSQSVTRVETSALDLKLLKIQASMVFGLRFLRLASAPELTRIRRRSQKLPRRLHSPSETRVRSRGP